MLFKLDEKEASRLMLLLLSQDNVLDRFVLQLDVKVIIDMVFSENFAAEKRKYTGRKGDQEFVSRDKKLQKEK